MEKIVEQVTAMIELITRMHKTILRNVEKVQQKQRLHLCSMKMETNLSEFCC